ncbi:NAD-dependent malic enzyme [Metallumcola ferriviriculae]|uniref:NAD-dependent malic enzyme n=1 Tax=Metallumcola ferriviriculae TaxID=3039180 RepID=A0AAU0UNG3_9FIRM|nr:NAD-dependent malic enzyme [Desulfitibacteraceae bacterium MK1]
MDYNAEAIKMHQEKQGKIEVTSKVPVKDSHDLSIAYTPGVAAPCKEIHADVNKVYDYTNKGNFVAVVSDGTAVLGLGDIGAEASMPVMEGKAVLFKAFAGVDAFPICVGTTDVAKIVELVKLLEPTFGGVNLEDIAAPACFEIEKRLKKETKIPIFHDDQHGTAIVVMAGMINALKIVNKKLEDIRVVTNGAGAAGIAIIKLLLSMGVRDVIMCDRRGMIYEGRTEGMNPAKEEIAEVTNRKKRSGSLADALAGADAFIGVSGPELVSPAMVSDMAEGAIIMAMANPVPEIMPDLAKEAGAKVVCTGRSDFPNQVNNVLAFPGIFRGALDTRATDINEDMKVAAAYAIAGLISAEELDEDNVIPRAFDPRVAPAVAKAVAAAAIKSGVAQLKVDPEEIAEKTRRLAGAK